VTKNALGLEEASEAENPSRGAIFGLGCGKSVFADILWSRIQSKMLALKQNISVWQMKFGLRRWPRIESGITKGVVCCSTESPLHLG
jgi:hypothetical protein